MSDRMAKVLRYKRRYIGRRPFIYCWGGRGGTVRMIYFLLFIVFILVAVITEELMAFLIWWTHAGNILWLIGNQSFIKETIGRVLGVHKKLVVQ